MDIGITKKDREKIADGLSHLLAERHRGATAILGRDIDLEGVEVQGVAESLSWMRCRPSATDLASLAASGSSGGLSAAHLQKEAMNAARSAEIRESARPDSMIGISTVAARSGARATSRSPP